MFYAARKVANIRTDHQTTADACGVAQLLQRCSSDPTSIHMKKKTLKSSQLLSFSLQPSAANTAWPVEPSLMTFISFYFFFFLFVSHFIVQLPKPEHFSHEKAVFVFFFCMGQTPNSVRGSAEEPGPTCGV